MMAWSTSNRRKELPKNWEAIRRRVFRRDRGLCQIGDPGCRGIASEVDHIDRGTDHSLPNLQAVCTPCHARKTRAEAAAARAAKPNEKRTAEDHPGLV